METKISLDEFLNEESKESFLCTIEPISKDQTKVKLKPYIDKQGCGCDSSLTIPKDLIENISVTDKIHTCCGKNHKVVEVFFKEGANLKIEDVWQATIERGKTKQKPTTNSNNLNVPLYQNSYPFISQTRGNARTYNAFRPFTDGCGLQSFPSGACTSGCQCLDLNNNTYCCPDACCL